MSKLLDQLPGLVEKLGLAADDSLLQWLSRQAEGLRRDFAESMSEAEVTALMSDWAFVGRVQQQAPQWPWTIWLILAGRGFGKATALSTPVPTPSGWTTMGDLSVGDYVFDESGLPTRVSWTSPISLGNQCYRVTFSDGAALVVDGDHEWVTSTWIDRKRSRSNTLASNRASRLTRDLAATLTHNGEVNHSIDLCGPMDLPTADLPLDPYVLGVWLGDGTASGPYACGIDPEIYTEVSRRGYPCRQLPSGKRCPLYHIDNLRPALETLGLLRSKNIPDRYLRSSYSQRLDLLRGLMDTDGCISKRGHCELAFSLERLADAAHDLICSLGIKVTRASRIPTFPYQGQQKSGARSYRLHFTTYLPICFLPRKLTRIHAARKQAARQFCRFITSIEPVPSVPVRCIAVESPSHQFLVTRSMVPTHNSRTGAEWVRRKSRTCGQLAVVGQSASDVYQVMLEGPSGLLHVGLPEERPRYIASRKMLIWPNGAQAFVYSAEDPDQLRGPDVEAAWADELAAWKPHVRKLAWDNLMMTLRRGELPQVVVTTTPRPVEVVKSILSMERSARNPSGTVAVTRGSTFANRANLAESFIETTIKPYLGTRLGRQEIYAEVLDDVQGALWTQEVIDRNRTDPSRVPDMAGLVVAVDPSISSEEGADEAGIVAAGYGTDGEFYVLADGSLKGTPESWGRAAVVLYDSLAADHVVAEVNQGGEMVRSVVQSAAEYLGHRGSIPYRPVHARRGKALRAEPVSALYAQNRVHHAGAFPSLESEMVSWAPNLGLRSPNRLDAVVYALTDLLQHRPVSLGGTRPASQPKQSTWSPPAGSPAPVPMGRSRSVWNSPAFRPASLRPPFGRG